MTQIPDLLRDPLFQLNTLLWLTQPLPTESSVTPLLYKQGFQVYAIAPLLPLPLDLGFAVKELGVQAQEGARPDVVLANEKIGKFTLMECKGKAFTVASTASQQLRTLLLLSGPRCAEILGLAQGTVKESMLFCLLPSSEHSVMSRTLTALTEEMWKMNLPTGETGLLCLSSTNQAVVIETDNKTAQFFGLNIGQTPFLILEKETDPRPLYFIPFDPDVEQSNEERIYCKRVLFERIHVSITAAVGRAVPPVVLPFQTDQLLNDAMLGIYELLENRDSRKHMRRLCRSLMDEITRSVNSVIAGGISYSQTEGWRIKLTDEQAKTAIANTLTRFSCETMNLKNEPQPLLFDEE